MKAHACVERVSVKNESYLWRDRFDPPHRPRPNARLFTYALNVAAPAIHVPNGELGVRDAWAPRFEPHSSALPVPVHFLGVGLLVRLLQIAGGLLTVASVPRLSVLNFVFHFSAKHPLLPLKCSYCEGRFLQWSPKQKLRAAIHWDERKILSA